MPGSPPSSTTAPATSPPPSTRSSSAMPVARRAATAAATWASGRGAPPAAPGPPPRDAGHATPSATSVFQAWQAGHWPSQRGAACPHCWQTNAVRRRLSTKDATRVDKTRRGRHVPGVQALDAVLEAELADLERRELRRGLRPLGSASDAEVEAKLAAFHGTEAALLFPSGYQANVGAIGALVGRGDHVFSDALNHASIIDGCRLSRATVHVYPHGDVEALARMLAAAPPGGRRLVVTDSVFSMDGDRAPLPELVAVAEQYHSWLMLDEAHATGVLGPRGAGLAEACGLAGRIAVHVGTLSKALGGAGGYVVGSRALIDALLNRARSFVYTTGIAPAAAAAAGAALDVIAAEPERRDALLRNAAHLREGLRRLGFAVGGDTHILPVLVGD